MDCSRVQKLLEEYFEGTLRARRREEVGAHLGECRDCSAELAQIERIAAALAAAPQVEPSAELLRTITTRAAALPAPGARQVLVTGWRRLGTLAAAFTAVLAGFHYGGPLLWPKVAAVLAPGATWVGKEVAMMLAWIGPRVEAVEVLVGAAWRMVEALGTAALAAGPTMGLYAAGELALLIGMALVFRWGRRRAAARVVTLLV